ncbi:glycosyltransferase family 2 protein [Caballeronia sp. RCC_10]|uniref:glycosyltransferase family 2 protein n=1 Tax=Caballeronia sp. RCC_10 TaxID=3239227 RepID=UPI003523EFB2
MIVIPMAGNSSRFYKAGYTRPKYELEIGGRTLFELTVGSFDAYFTSETFVFVVRQDFAATRFVDEMSRAVGIASYHIVELHAPTRGQAETVLAGIEDADRALDERLLVFNIDTIRPGYRIPEEVAHADGYLEVFRAEGDHWSFVRPASADSHVVIETTEKRRISDLCCTGLYFFSAASDFVSVFSEAMAHYGEFEQQWRELYIAPLYNTLIERGKRIVYHEVPASDVLLAGTPEEYVALAHQRVQA